MDVMFTSFQCKSDESLTSRVLAFLNKEKIEWMEVKKINVNFTGTAFPP